MSDKNFSFGQQSTDQNNKTTTGGLFGQGTTVPFMSTTSQVGQQPAPSLFGTTGANNQLSNNQTSNLQQSSFQPNLNQTNTFQPSANQPSALPQPNFQTNAQTSMAQPNLTQINTQQTIDQAINDTAAPSSFVHDDVHISASDIPLSFPQSTITQILDQIETRLAQDIAYFQNKAEQVALCDKQIIKIRNNYIEMMDRIKKEENNLKEIEESLSAMEEWVESAVVANPADRQVPSDVSAISRIEQSYDDLLNSIQAKNDIENSLTGIINENMRLLKCINKELDEII
ncbi:Nuclear pore complex, Nup98 component (sc Nup145/Nup100/Nup116) [Pseudoloma neurophilia]|uniref:Nuclear pore complex, Nup98 component (Sc Nup145/Nup100/Nup116) n=1 Tax=Pseudoloma neurophilia TaxID=146866 RepID=A0A0R0M3K5_9MICR|nr:Nuclear pore complex, Nup98 component (sc Nup145/Nup100/Nup116) [Pseudoloma neurophilia]